MHHLIEFEKGPLLNELLAIEWPNLHSKLHVSCQLAIIEFFEVVMVGIVDIFWIPHELRTCIVKFIVEMWPLCDPHTPLITVQLDSEEIIEEED